MEKLFGAYFTEGRNIGDHQTLIALVVEAGLDQSKAQGMLNSDDGMEAIREANQQARRIGVGGVPFFIINGNITLSGAQPPDVFLDAFGEAAAD